VPLRPIAGDSEFGGDIDWMRRVIQEADWLTAIGERGIARCAAYSAARGTVAADIAAAVCRHIREKLWLIQYALTFDSARTAAAALSAPLAAYLRAHERTE
jgi:hypothetical protein